VTVEERVSFFPPVIGIITGLGIFLSLNWKVWPEVNFGVQAILLSLGLWAFFWPEGLGKESGKITLLFLILGFLTGILISELGVLQIAFLLLSVGVISDFAGKKFGFQMQVCSFMGIILSLPIVLLSMVSGGVELPEILLFLATVISIGYYLEEWVNRKLMFAAPIFFMFGAIVFREINGNIEFAGSDAIFNFGLAIAGLLAIVWGNEIGQIFVVDDEE